jgi:predicted transposase/invertase (TIGR01784 family)
MSRYIDLFTDFGFKRIFGTPNFSEPLLKSVLEAILGLSAPISEITFINTVQTPKSADEKACIFDLSCKDADGNSFIVEMQKSKVAHFKDRMIYYSTFPITQQVIPGGDYYLKPVYCVAIVDFLLEDPKDKPLEFKASIPLHDVALRYPNGSNYSDKVNFFILEMPRFIKSYEEVRASGSLVDLWFYLLKNLRHMEAKPELFHGNMFDKLFQMAEEANMNAEERQQYFQSLKRTADAIALHNTARQEGLEQGLEQGRQEGEEIGLAKGEEIGTIKMIKKFLPRMLKDNQSLIDIAAELEVSVELVEQVRRELRL